MKNILFLFAVAVLTIGCNKNDSQQIIPFSQLDKLGIELFPVDSVSFQSFFIQYTDVRIDFIDNVYGMLATEQKPLINGYVIYKNDVERFRFDISRKWFVDQNQTKGSTICYKIAYDTELGLSTFSEDICVDVPL